MSQDSNREISPGIGLCRDVLLLLYPVFTIGFAYFRVPVGYVRQGFELGVGGVSASESRFLQGAMRVYDVLQVGRSGERVKGTLYAHPMGFLGGVACQLTFLVSCACVALLVAMLARNIRPKGTRGFTLSPWVCVISLLVWLACWWDVNRARVGVEWLLSSVYFSILSVALFIMGAALAAYLAIKRSEITHWRLLVYGALLIAHFGFWFVAVTARLMVPVILIPVAIAGKGAFWLARNRPGEGNTEFREHARVKGTRLLVSAACVLILWLIWSPFPRITHAADSKRIDSLVIRLTREEMIGPRYSLSVHGDGRIEYMGAQYVQVRGLQTKLISVREVQRVARMLDGIDFFRLDGRIFTACPHMPFVQVSLSVDGKEKSVGAIDCRSVMFEAPQQHELLKIADEIDRVAGSDSWTRCDGPCPR